MTDIPRSASRPFLLVDLSNTGLKKIPETPLKTKSRSLEDCTITRLDSNIQKHIVLCGCPRSRFGLYHFLQPLLIPTRVGEYRDPILVVVLNTEPPSPATWAEVADMPNILYLQGSGMKAEDLVAAGIERARAVVVLSSSTGVPANTSSGGKRALSSLAEAADTVYAQDADVILTTRAIHSTLASLKSEQVFTISEMVHTKTFNLLARNESDVSEFFLAPGFAAGYFYDAGITERLIYLCHEKRFLKDIFSKIFSSKHKKRSTFISQIPVPTDLGQETVTYGTVFGYSVRRNMIPIGLYRPMSEDQGDDAYFVTINPPAHTILQERDRIFVWCSVLK